MGKPHMNPWVFFWWWVIYHGDRSPISLWRESKRIKAKLRQLEQS